MRFRHIALLAGDDLRGAEEYYRRLFDFEVVLREGPLEPGGPDAELWGQLPPDRTWDDAEKAGVEIGMVALERDEVILALFALLLATALLTLVLFSAGVAVWLSAGSSDTMEAEQAQRPDRSATGLWRST